MGCVLHIRRPKPTMRHARVPCASSCSAAETQHADPDEKSSQITVADYWEREGKRLEKPHWPCVVVLKQAGQLHIPLERCRYVHGRACTGADVNVLPKLVVRSIVSAPASPVPVHSRHAVAVQACTLVRLHSTS